MVKRGKNRFKLHWEIVVSMLVLIALSSTIIFLKPALTGFVIYGEPEERIKSWNFSDPAEYIYDPNLINLSEGKVKLAEKITLNTWTTEEITFYSLTFAEENEKDKLSKITALDDDLLILEKDHLLKIKFNENLQDQDKINLYLKGEEANVLNFCDFNVEESCEEGTIFASLDYLGVEGFYSLTIPLSALIEGITIIPLSKKIKIDYINTSHLELVEHTTVTREYCSAEIQTIDLQPPSLGNWRIFSHSENLNGQNVGYQYSTDSGNSWQTLPPEGNLESVESEKIRFNVQLSSEGTATPEITELTLSYATLSCNENWVLHYGKCQPNDQKQKYYLDEKGCGTTEELPEDNGTLVGCDYCTPQLINTSTEEWADTEECQANNQKLQSRSKLQHDFNNCGEVENFTFVEQQEVFCDYCSLNNCTGSFKETISPNENNFMVVDAAETNARLEITSHTAVESATVSLVEYNWTTKELPPNKIAAQKYLEINSNLGNIDAIKIIVYYNDSELGNIEENTLKIHCYNESRGEWKELDSVVNATGNYVYAVVSHLSLYGLFGKEGSSSTATEPSSGSGGGGSRRSLTTPPVEEKSEETIPLKTIIEEEITPLEAKTGCDYVIEVSLPEKISLLKEKSYQGEVINKGNCLIQKLNFYINPELEDYIYFSPVTIENLAVDNKSTFQIIRRTTQDDSWLSPLTGSAIIEKIIAKEISGIVKIEGTEKEESLFSQELPIKIEILAPEKLFWTIKIVSPGIGLVTLIFSLLIIFFRKNNKTNIN